MPFRPSDAALAIAALLLVAGCGDDTQGAGPVRCPSGQVLEDGACVPDRGRSETDASTDVTETDTSELDTSETPDAEDAATDAAAPDVTPGEDVGADAAPCAEGAVRCGPAGVPETCEGGAWVEGDPCRAGQICLAGRCVNGGGCDPGTVNGCWSETELSVCNAAGDRVEPVSCLDDPAGPWCFEGACGTQRCEPGRRRCDGDFVVEECDSTGQEWLEAETCDRREDRVCAGGECVSGCVAAGKDPTYIGCEYWSVDLPQYEDPFTAGPALPHSVVVANVGDYPATVEVTTRSPGVTPPATIVVEPGDAGTLTFPRLDVAGTEQTDRSFRITSTEPIVAYQFNPLNNVNLFSNDASLLLPVNAIGTEYLVLGWPGGAIQPSFFTVVATASGTTTVDITFASDVVDGEFTGIRAGSTHTYTLAQGDVLNFSIKTRISFPPVVQDATGTRIVANRPVIVFSGHEQAVIGEGEPGGFGEPDGDVCCADHLEQQLFPLSTWGSHYFAVHSPPRGSEDDYWRVLAAEPGTLIATTPPIDGLDGVTLGAGEVAEVATNQSFEIQATGPILVGQFLVSQTARGTSRTTGDPAFILPPPASQLRDEYVVMTPNGYDEDWLTLVAPVGVTVTLDGAPVAASAFTTFGTGTHAWAHVAVEPGPHQLSAPQPFAVTVIGYDNAVSYGYPGGLDLTGADFEVEE